MTQHFFKSRNDEEKKLHTDLQNIIIIIIIVHKVRILQIAFYIDKLITITFQKQ